MRRHVALLRACLIPFALIFSVSTLAFASDMQRMLLSPGCYRIAANSAEDVSAYCLDQSRAAPSSGALLADSSTALGATVIKLASGKSVGLAEAIRRHLVQIEGLGNQYQLRLRNLTGEPIELCVIGPTVVMGNGETYVGDLSRIRARIEKLVATGTASGPSSAAGSDPHAQIQEKIWEEVARSEREENDDLSRAILLGPVFPMKQAPPVVVRGSKCATETTRSEVCFE